MYWSKRIEVAFLFVLAFCLQYFIFVESQRVGIPEGSLCDMENNTGKGVCAKVRICRVGIQQITKTNQSYTGVGRCGFDGNNEITCCPPQDILDIGYIFKIIKEAKPAPDPKIDYNTLLRLHEKVCLKKIHENDNHIIMKATVLKDGYNASDINMLMNGPRKEVIKIFDPRKPGDEGRVIGGISVQHASFPYMGGLFTVDSNDPESTNYVCGAILIHREFLLTAAHCFNNNNQLPNLVKFDPEIPEISSKIDKFIKHPLYKPSTNYHDIAIVKMISPDITVGTPPVCLIRQSISNQEEIANKFLYVTGWGATDLMGDPVTTLQRSARLQIVNKSSRNQWYELPQYRYRYPYGINDSIICAIDPDEERRSDACQGDSGGPLLLQASSEIKSNNAVIGIISASSGCGTKVPTTYTSVYHYLDWIESVIPIKIKRRKSRSVE